MANVKDDCLYYAYQPIVNIHSGATLGFEALLRGWDDAGYSSIDDVFNTAFETEDLYRLDLHLRKLAFEKIYQNTGFSNLKLFYNLDNRVLEMPDYLPGNTKKLLEGSSLHSTNICYEISEKHEFGCYNSTQKILQGYKKSKLENCH